MTPTKADRLQAERFANLCDSSGVEMTPENCLKCIGFAKDAMQRGDVSVEAFFVARNLLMNMVEVSNGWTN